MTTKAAAVVKTTVRLPREVWLAARTRALADGVDLQDLVTAALRSYLKLETRRESR